MNISADRSGILSTVGMGQGCSRHSEDIEAKTPVGRGLEHCGGTRTESALRKLKCSHSERLGGAPGKPSPGRDAAPDVIKVASLL